MWYNHRCVAVAYIAGFCRLRAFSRRCWTVGAGLIGCTHCLLSFVLASDVTAVCFLSEPHLVFYQNFLVRRSLLFAVTFVACHIFSMSVSLADLGFLEGVLWEPKRALRGSGLTGE